jgi:hypothetical protein
MNADWLNFVNRWANERHLSPEELSRVRNSLDYKVAVRQHAHGASDRILTMLLDRAAKDS